MSYKPILFNTEMVKAIKDGRKTQTRRVCKGQGECSPVQCGYYPPYKPGDILWVRETWSTHYDGIHDDLQFCYKADGLNLKSECLPGENNRWYPSIHMPKEAARIFLRVKDVRVERLCQITPQDAVSEGISRLFDHMTKAEYEEWANRSGVQVPQHEQSWTNYMWHGRFGAHGMGNKLSDAWPWQASGYEYPRLSFSSLWNSTVPLKEWDNYGWDANPWVWVIEFERCEKPSDFR